MGWKGRSDVFRRLWVCPVFLKSRVYVRALLSDMLIARFTATKTTADLDEGVEVLEDACRTFHPSSPDRAIAALARRLWTRFQRFRNPSDLQEAITFR